MAHRLGEIKCDSLKVVNSDGEVVASIGSDEDGNGKVVLFDRWGKPRVEVNVTGEIIVFDELHRAKERVGTNQKGNGVVLDSGRDRQFERTPRTNARLVKNLGSSGQPRRGGDGQAVRSTERNLSPGGNIGSPSYSELGRQQIRGDRDSVTYTKPVAVTFGRRRCAARNGSWRKT